MNRPIANSDAFMDFCSWFIAEKGIGCLPTMWDLIHAICSSIPDPDSYYGEHIEVSIEPNPLVDIHWRHYSVDVLRETTAGNSDGVIPIFELSQLSVNADGSIAGRVAILPYLLQCYSAFTSTDAQ